MKLALHWRILIGLALGVLVGVAINELWTARTWESLGVGDRTAFFAFSQSDANAAAGFSAAIVRFAVQLNDFIGKLFVRSLQFVALPIIVCSIVAGAAGLGDLRTLGRIGGRTVLLFISTTVVAILIGLALTNAVKPGKAVPAEARERFAAERASEVAQREAATRDVPGAWQQALNIVPRNPFEALATANYLQVIIACLALGMGLALLPRERTGPLIGALEAAGEACVKVVHAIMWCAPVGVFALMVPQSASLGLGVLSALGVYAAVVVGGLALILFVEYPLLLILLARISPVRFFKAMAPAQLVALSSSSSSATLPVTMACVRERLGVSERITRFVCPMGATINMDGTALYQAVAAVFVAQMFGMELSLSDQAALVAMATLSSIGAPGIPSGGIVLLMAILQTFHLPAAGLAVILALDRPLDMLRTVVNVSGDAMASAVIDRFEPKEAPTPLPASA